MAPSSSHIRSFKFGELIDYESEFHEPCCDQKPSSCFCDEVSWIWAFTPIKRKSVNSGKWLLFVNRNNADEIWDKVKTLLAANRLGVGAKISVQEADNDNFVICVYTYDYEDVQDVFRVLIALRRSRLESKAIHYKTDVATLAGVYKTDEAAKRAGFNRTTLVNPSKKVSMYTSPRSFIDDPTGAVENIKLLLNNIGPDFKSGLIAELLKDSYDSKERILFYDPPRMLEDYQLDYRQPNRRYR